MVTAQPTRRAISALDTPACANSTILARRTSACGEDARRSIASSLALRRAPNTTVSRLAARTGAEDVSQEAFLNIWRSGARYDRGRGSVRTWVLGIVHHRAIDYLRRAPRPVLADFVHRCHKLVPAGSEGSFLDLDAELEMLLHDDLS